MWMRALCVTRWWHVGGCEKEVLRMAGWIEVLEVDGSAGVVGGDGSVEIF